MKLSGAVAMMFAAALSTVAIAAPLSDWPQWRGPDRSGVSAETGLLQQWPQNGPPQVWTVQSLGAGYGSLAVAGDRIFVQSLKPPEHRHGDGGRWTGDLVEEPRLAARTTRVRPRSTPHGRLDRIYALTESGDCMPQARRKSLAAAQHPARARRPEHSRADQRVAHRRQSRHRLARRSYRGIVAPTNDRRHHLKELSDEAYARRSSPMQASAS
jgi:hypothetical protein